MTMDRPLFTYDRFPEARRRRNRRTTKHRIWETARSHRPEVLDRDGHRCVWCESTDELTLDHIVPVVEFMHLPFVEQEQYTGPANLRSSGDGIRRRHLTPVGHHA